MKNLWTPEDRTKAAAQGWVLFEVWEAGRFEWVVMREAASNIFLTDEAARLYVRHRQQQGDVLCTKALKLIIQSHMPRSKN